jgi:Cu(I)/Ag(I) efflux system membrane fusion protein
MNYPRRTLLRLMLYSGASLSLAGCMKHVASMPDNVDYYTCTMHPSVRSHDPLGKCPICGMDLVPVMKKGLAPVLSPASAGENTSEFTVPVERQQQIGVTYATVARRPLHSTIRAAGLVEYDKSRHWAFVAPADGSVEQVFVTSPGQPVEKGEPLISISSPDLLAGERELVTLLKTRDDSRSKDADETRQNLIDAAEARLRQWNVTPDQIAALEKTRRPGNHLILCSPFRGIVQAIPVTQGATIKAGDILVEVADLSELCVWADVYEDELDALQQGQDALVTVNALPARKYEGKIMAITPSIDEATHTARARIDIANSGLALRPGMVANVELLRDIGQRLAVPISAIIPTGIRNIAFVDRGGGKLSPREVQLGGKFGEFYEVIGGLKEGDRVVSSANFLIDAESKVQGALKDFDTSDPAGGTQ